MDDSDVISEPRMSCVVNSESVAHSSGAPRKYAKIVILGAGPAGLAAAIYARMLGCDVLLLEMGRDAGRRTRYDAEDLVAGAGGAGLYSDGKFSFFPAATRLWQLDDAEALRSAYQWLYDIVGSSIQVPDFPANTQANRLTISEIDSLKRYPSQYMDFPSRLALIKRLTAALDSDIHTDSVLEHITKNSGDRLTVRYRNDNGVQEVETNAIIIAGGRFGGLTLKRQAPWVPTTFRRYEVGVRLEASASNYLILEMS